MILPCICHITDSSDPGGAENVILLLIDELARRGVRQELVLLNDGWLAAEARSRNLSTLVLPTHGSFDWRWVGSCARRLRELGADIVHVHLLDAGFYGSAAACIARRPCVATEHGDVAMGEKKGLRFTLKLAVTQALSRRVVAVSEMTRLSLLSRVRFGSAKTTVIYNGVSTAFLASAVEQFPARASFGVPADARVIGTIGALTPVKDQATLLHAHARLPGDVVCLVAGAGPLLETLRDLARSLGTADRVVFTGFTRDVARVLAAMDVFCLSSTSEGLPLVLIEALAVGRPVVCTDVGGVPEVLAKAGGGRTVPAGDPESLARAIQDALDGRVPTVPLPPEFRVERMVDAYLELYRSVIANER